MAGRQSEQGRPATSMPMRLACTLLACLALGATSRASESIDFWDQPQHGANSFNGRPPTLAYFQALRATGATWVRLTFSKWPGAKGEFLLGDSDHYAGLPAQDVAVLVQTIAAADKARLKVVVAPLSLPGCRWRQLNGGRRDDRLWTDKAYWAEAAAFWRDLATALKDQPNIVALNIVNEPDPEEFAALKQGADTKTVAAWISANRDKAAYLPAFYGQMTAAIRQVDPATSIMIDSGWYGNALGLGYWPAKLADSKILYSVHMYEPWEATSSPNVSRHPQLRYPGTTSWVGDKEVRWDKAVLQAYIAGPFAWAKARGVPQERVVVGEFGCVRQWRDCAGYLGDVLDTLDARRAHWAFYSFREDVWDAMNYELPAAVTPGAYYEAAKTGSQSALYAGPHPLMDIIVKHMPAPVGSHPALP